MSADKIFREWKNKTFKPVYWLEGEEDYYIDKLMRYAEEHILPEAETGFNLTVFYGRDANWPEVVNACCRYPMFAEKQVVLLKEAQQMKEIDKLEHYIARPLASTIFIVAYKEKKLDGRSRLSRVLKEKAEILTTKKIYDNQLPDWTNDLVKSKGYTISQKALMLLADHIGNDLTRIDNEIDKLLINLGERKNITEDDIERFVGISKEYNVFELQHAFGRRDLAKAIRIIQYFESNPKVAPIQMVLPALYNFFSKAFMIFSAAGSDEKSIAATTGISSYFVKDYIHAVNLYAYEGIEKALLLLHEYNLKSIGINDTGTPDASLLKELAFKIIM